MDMWKGQLSILSANGRMASELSNQVREDSIGLTCKDGKFLSGHS